MFDIQTVSVVLASVGVVAGVIYYILDIQHQKKIRETDLIMRTYPIFNMSYKEVREYILHLPPERKNYDEFVRIYGSLESGRPEPETIVLFLDYFDTLGILMKRKLLSIDLVYEFYGASTAFLSDRLMPLIEGARKEGNGQAWTNCEYLFDEMKKRKQELERAEERKKPKNQQKPRSILKKAS